MEQNSTEIRRDETLEKTMREICCLLADMHDPVFTYDFFECLFTPAELKDFSNRWLLVKEIRKGTTQREIARMFGMSLCKITRGSRELKKENSAFRRMLDMLEKETGKI
jgi:TrpR family transcriptional regulator, trp operon repressor